MDAHGQVGLSELVQHLNQGDIAAAVFAPGAVTGYANGSGGGAWRAAIVPGTEAEIIKLSKNTLKQPKIP